MSAPEGSSPALVKNRLLARLSARVSRRLRPQLESVPLALKEVLYERGGPIRYIYFPTQAIVSMLAVMDDGTSVEVATIGNEGMTGLPALLGDAVAHHQVVVQVPGEAVRVRAAVLKRGPGLPNDLLSRYLSAFLTQISQSVACNSLHALEQRCCRWLLMTHDRVRADQFPLTQESLAQMLGVRRASVTEVARALQDRGLIRSSRGQITLLDRRGLESVSCECYRIVKAEFDRLLR